MHAEGRLVFQKGGESFNEAMTDLLKKVLWCIDEATLNGNEEDAPVWVECSEEEQDELCTTIWLALWQMAIGETFPMDDMISSQTSKEYLLDAAPTFLDAYHAGTYKKAFVCFYYHVFGEESGDDPLETQTQENLRIRLIDACQDSAMFLEDDTKLVIAIMAKLIRVHAAYNGTVNNWEEATDLTVPEAQPGIKAVPDKLRPLSTAYTTYKAWKDSM